MMPLHSMKANPIWHSLVVTGAILLASAYGEACATSTINPNVPAYQSRLASAPIQGNFAAAYNDINNLLSEYAGPTAPLSPTVGQFWRNTSTNPQSISIWDGTNWVLTGTLNVSTHVYSSAVNAENFAATAPLSVTFVGSIATYALNYDSNFTSNGSNQLALASIAAGYLLGNCTVSSAEPTACTWNSFANQAIGSTNGEIPYRTGGSWGTISTGTSGAALGLLNGNNTYSGLDTFSNTVNFTGTMEIDGVTASTSINGTTCTLGQSCSIPSIGLSLTRISSNGGTVNMTSTSTAAQELYGTANETYVLPDATTVGIGAIYTFNNDSTGTLTIEAYGGSTIATVGPGGFLTENSLSNSTQAGNWDGYGSLPDTVQWGTSGLVMNGTNITGIGQVSIAGTNSYEDFVLNEYSSIALAAGIGGLTLEQGSFTNFDGYYYNGFAAYFYTNYFVTSLLAMSMSTTGVVTIPELNTAGFVTNDALGDLGTSPLGTNVAAALGNALNSSSTLATLGGADQTLSGGANVTVYANSTGNLTVDCGKSPLQYIADTGAFTLTAPSNDGSCILQIEMGSGASTITFSGFSEGSNVGDALVYTSGDYFQISIVRIHSKSHYLITALQ